MLNSPAPQQRDTFDFDDSPPEISHTRAQVVFEDCTDVVSLAPSGTYAVPIDVSTKTHRVLSAIEMAIVLTASGMEFNIMITHKIERHFGTGIWFAYWLFWPGKWLRHSPLVGLRPLPQLYLSNVKDYSG